MCKSGKRVLWRHQGWQKMKRKITPLVLGLMFIALLMGIDSCTGTAQAPSPTATLPVPNDKVLVQNSSFAPSSTVVTVGASVTWTNRDHEAYFIAEDNQSFAFNLPAGGSFKFTFADAGIFNYHCMIHPSMQGTVIVSNGDSCGIPDKTQPAVAEVISKMRPSVVMVSSQLETTDIFGRPLSKHLDGTGWVLNEGGLIVTNNHVVAGAKNVTVTLDGGQTYSARTVRTDPVNDLAVIDIGLSNLQAAKIGDSASVSVGDKVIALGNTFGEGIKATSGVISAVNFTLVIDAGETLYNILQTTAPISFGNSGGPLVNMNGEVIGITSAGEVTRSGNTLVGYAITTGVAGPVLEQLVQKGSVVRPWLGVTTSSVDQFQCMGYQLESTEGALITKIAAGSPAQGIGLVPGDIIDSFDGLSIASTDDLVKAVRGNHIGQPVEIRYWRDINLNTATVTLSPEIRN
jgi:serine protease Do